MTLSIVSISAISTCSIFILLFSVCVPCKGQRYSSISVFSFFSLSSIFIAAFYVYLMISFHNEDSSWNNSMIEKETSCLCTNITYLSTSYYTKPCHRGTCPIYATYTYLIDFITNNYTGTFVIECDSPCLDYKNRNFTCYRLGEGEYARSVDFISLSYSTNHLIWGCVQLALTLMIQCCICNFQYKNYKEEGFVIMSNLKT